MGFDRAKEFLEWWLSELMVMTQLFYGVDTTTLL